MPRALRRESFLHKQKVTAWLEDLSATGSIKTQSAAFASSHRAADGQRVAALVLPLLAAVQVAQLGRIREERPGFAALEPCTLCAAGRPIRSLVRPEVRIGAAASNSPCQAMAASEGQSSTHIPPSQILGHCAVGAGAGGGAGGGAGAGAGGPTPHFTSSHQGSTWYPCGPGSAPLCLHWGHW